MTRTHPVATGRIFNRRQQVEQWPDEAAAQKRAEYIKTILSSAPILGSEYQAVKGNLLLRVSGKLKPSAAEIYTKAFEG